MTVKTTLPRARDPESNSDKILADLAARAAQKKHTEQQGMARMCGPATTSPRGRQTRRMAAFS